MRPKPASRPGRVPPAKGRSSPTRKAASNGASVPVAGNLPVRLLGDALVSGLYPARSKDVNALLCGNRGIYIFATIFPSRET